VIPVVLEAAASQNTAIAAPAQELLPAFGTDAIDTLYMAGRRDYTQDHRKWDVAAQAIARMGEPALRVVLKMFTRENPAGSRWTFAVEVLYRMGSLAVEPLVPLLKHPNEKIRQRAASLLASFGDPRSYEALEDGLHSQDEIVRMYSAMGLGKIGDRDAVDALLSALGDPSSNTRAAAAGALGRMWEHRFLGPVARVARGDREIRTRDTAAGVLIDRVNDPVAVRIGRRYQPAALSPARQGAVLLGYLMRLGLTSLFLLAVGLVAQVGSSRRSTVEQWLAFGFVAALAFGLGFVWGRLVEHIDAGVEHLLLLMFVPVVLFIGWLLGEPGGAPFRLSPKRAGWLWTVGNFYLGYGIGWLALWGYLSG
jgi:hypothetical protein